jgi:hypothetical protein
MVWIGLISYPLYLWHWPILSLLRIIESETPAWHYRLVAVVLAFVLATLTYLLIEKPIRYGFKSQSQIAKAKWQQYVTGILIILMIAVGYVGWNTYEREGLGGRMHFNLPMGIAQLQANQMNYWAGDASQNFKTGTPKIVIYGDSQAWDLFIALKNNPKYGLKYFGHSFKCSAFFSPNYGMDGTDKLCDQFYQAFINSTELKEADILIYSHDWEELYEIPENYGIALKQIRTINPQIQVIFFGPKPFLGLNKSINRVLRNKSPANFNDHLNKIKKIDDKNILYVKKIAEQNGAQFINVTDIFCGNALCPFFMNNEFMYFDSHHWTFGGGKRFYENLMQSEDFKKIKPIKE